MELVYMDLHQTTDQHVNSSLICRSFWEGKGDPIQVNRSGIAEQITMHSPWITKVALTDLCIEEAGAQYLHCACRLKNRFGIDDFFTLTPYAEELGKILHCQIILDRKSVV